ncbi:MAG: SMP-30/gluconolactonase/LRE family protein [Caulobacteraceae bacterium]|nr:SMP-30/gluconolactonase/LRE family protein [Caulobacteraceae bacterium]
MTGGFEQVLEAGCALGESPAWLAEEGCLVFVDITGRRLHWFHPASGEHRDHPVEEDIGCVAPARGGGFVAGLRSGIWLLDTAGAKQRMLAGNPEDAATNRFNDGKVDPRGRYFAGTIDEPKAGGRAGLYRCDRRGLKRITDGLMTSNGLGFSPDGRVMYHADTPRFVVWRWDYDPASGEAANRHAFVRIEPTAQDRGRPDGAAVDAEGCYWTALYEGGRIHRYDPDGRLMAAYPLGARKPTMPAFGGPDLKTLYVTTAADEGGEGGGLYALDAGVAGAPIPAFDPEA